MKKTNRGKIYKGYAVCELKNGKTYIKASAFSEQFFIFTRKPHASNRNPGYGHEIREVEIKIV
jgi:hypothetical protein